MERLPHPRSTSVVCNVQGVAHVAALAVALCSLRWEQEEEAFGRLIKSEWLEERGTRGS